MATQRDRLFGPRVGANDRNRCRCKGLCHRRDDSEADDVPFGRVKQDAAVIRQKKYKEEFNQTTVPAFDRRA